MGSHRNKATNCDILARDFADGASVEGKTDGEEKADVNGRE